MNIKFIFPTFSEIYQRGVFLFVCFVFFQIVPLDSMQIYKNLCMKAKWSHCFLVLHAL